LSPELEAYQDGPVGVLRRMARAGYLAPGDPAKMAKAIVDTFEATVVPPRLALRGRCLWVYRNGSQFAPYVAFLQQGRNDVYRLW